MTEEFYYLIEEAEAGLRVDVYLSGKFPGISRSQVQRLIEDDRLLVNARRVKSSHKLKAGDEVEFELPPAVELKVEAENIPLEIIYQDEYLAVINKPVGLVVHPAPGNEHGTLVNALLYHLTDLSSVNGVIRPGIVHRIDKDTSGLLVIAKNDEAHQALSKQLADHSMTREYVALCEGLVKMDQGTIDAPIGRDPRNRLRMGIVPNGRRAVTHYTVQQRYQDMTLVRLRLETGRTHQIRVHMASIHHPVAADPVYGFKKQRVKYQGQMLHARLLGFLHPRDGQPMEFSVPVPEEFRLVLEKLAAEKAGRRV
ncbi:RluA family pseudouridine synthase [Proteiniclasticum sp. QWL-01]|uniref:RluA family pseudouridine synthase n=1 Tax=Proteiniclasticum sp. QWL-01 TaxID=3036945 RepID=UPI0024113B82|nr:RluA family pseudouridine synthase [Proteiniclasticum sp. QWL-01]WFF74210.1 RluA family pseudouridine synthase [Proteiniclasticum sp. QWL-01]